MKPKAILLGLLIIICVGLLLDLVLTIAWWEIKDISDGPWWIGFLVFGFAYLCALPAVLVPYCFLAAVKGRRDSHGIGPAAFVGIAYPACLLALTYLGGLVIGHGRMVWDKLVESPHGWGVLLVITLVPGVLVSYCAMLIDRVVRQAHDKQSAPHEKSPIK